eukprot:TRINITY_DN35108_c1_g1_i3.p1 TRINITY_DN35108_c1_g1~~TRINITY_DN35108_c1_g1_i3.p1  ORF type:complete len:250 (+),score=41.54 TRINITY_DN35108_c1_g1_i3:77-826(+)
MRLIPTSKSTALIVVVFLQAVTVTLTAVGLPHVPLSLVRLTLAFHLMWRSRFWRRFNAKMRNSNLLRLTYHVRKDVGSIKTDIGYVKAKCDEIGKRCDRLEEENERLSSSVTDTKEDVTELFSACTQNENSVTMMFSRMKKMESEMNVLKEHCDTLESFSRRDNLRLYGVPQTNKCESFDTCAKLVADTLNSVESPKKWSADDIARAHRVVESRNGQPKPMIVKFGRWKDKMAVLTNREYRTRLGEKGV